jgi:hypothetical protein
VAIAVSAPAQAAPLPHVVRAHLTPADLQYFEQQCRLISRLHELGIPADPSQADFFLATDFGLQQLPDDYDAMQRMAGFFSGATGSRPRVVIFPPGKISILRAVETGGPRRNATRDITFRQAGGVALMGCNTQLNVAGDFAFPLDLVHMGYGHSFRKQVIPFDFMGGAAIALSGFNISGNINASPGRGEQRSGNGAIVETTSYGVFARGVFGLTLVDLNIHHFATDGLRIDAGKGAASKNLLILRTSSHNNARQGLTIGTVSKVHVKDSAFSGNGITDGAYLGHSPMAGIDIEPDQGGRASDILIENCDMKNNAGSALLAAHRQTTRNVVLRNSTISNSSGGRYLIIMSVPDGEITGNTIDAAAGSIFPFWHETDGAVPASDVSTLFKDNTVLNAGRGLTVDLKVDDAKQMMPAIDIVNNRFVESPGGGDKLPYLVGNAVSTFSGNTVTYAAARRPGDVVGYVYATTIAGNVFDASAVTARPLRVALKSGVDSSPRLVSIGGKRETP